MRGLFFVVSLSLVVGLLGCGASPIEQAKAQWAKAAAARARGDQVAHRAALEGTLQAARRDTRKVMDAEAAQLNLLSALALADQAALSLPPEARATEARLGLLAAAQPRWLPAKLRTTRLAAQCRWAGDAGHEYYAALCWDALLDRVPKANQGLRAAAIQGLIRASGRRDPPWMSLKNGHGDPTLARLLQGVAADPLDVDAVVLVARSLEDLCGVPGFERDLAGWQMVQADLLDAVIALDGFKDHDLRCTARAVRADGLRRPLCGGSALKKPPQAPPSLWPRCPKDAALGGS